MATILAHHRIRLAVRSPFLFRGLTPGAQGLDAAALRDGAGRPLLPSDQIRGVLREALEDLAEVYAPSTEALQVGRLFGAISPEEHVHGTANEPKRRRIHFTDLVATGMVRDGTALLAATGEDPPADRISKAREDLPKATEWTRVEIDPARGAVKTGALQVLELVAPMGAVVLFEGSIETVLPQGDLSYLTDRLTKALALVGSIGGLKSPGFGEVLTELSAITPDDDRTRVLALPAESAGSGGERRYHVTFDRPVLFDTFRIADNAVAGAKVIPGTTFKGTLAEVLEHMGHAPQDPQDPVGQALAGLSVSHAFPLDPTGGRLERALPLSMVAAKVEKAVVFGDALAVPLERGALLGGRPGIFPGDWKDENWDPAKEKAGFSTAFGPARLARTHTAIDPDWGTAKDADLYTTLLVSHLRDDGTPWRWEVTLDPTGIADPAIRGEAERLLTLLEEWGAAGQGLYGMGGTGATARFQRVTDAPPSGLTSVHGRSGQYALLLDTPAVLFDPQEVWNEQGERPALEVYQSYFNTVVPGARLVNFYASQRLAGGYVARRRRTYGKDVYFPFVLTEAGSIFLLEVTEDAGKAALERIARRGLPAAPLDGRPPDWRTNPYLPEHGYGRVSTAYLSTADQVALMEAVTTDA